MFKNIVMQMRKGNCEKGYSVSDTGGGEYATYRHSSPSSMQDVCHMNLV